MKNQKLIPFLIIVIFIVQTAFAASISFTAEKTTKQVDISTVETVLYATVKNESEEHVKIRAIRLAQESPPGWATSLCFGNCYRKSADTTNSLIFAPGNYFKFSLIVYPNHINPGKAVVDVKMEAENGDSETLTFTVSNVQTGIEKNEQFAQDFKLYQNYPNPFNPATKISYRIKGDSFIKINIYNILGEMVRTLVNERVSQGFHSVTWHGKNSQEMVQPAGIYYYQLQVIQGGQVQQSMTKQMVMLQ